LFTLAAAFALVAVAVTPAAAQNHGPSMSFRVAPLESHECGRHCPDVIVADGVIRLRRHRPLSIFSSRAARTLSCGA